MSQRNPPDRSTRSSKTFFAMETPEQVRQDEMLLANAHASLKSAAWQILLLRSI